MWKKALCIILFVSVGCLSACNENGIIKVGNPDISEPTPVEKVKGQLKEEPFWIGDCSSGGTCDDQLYIVKYDVDASLLEVLSEDNSINEKIPFSISEEGVVTAETADYVVVAKLVKDLIQVEFTMFECEYTFSLISTDDPEFSDVVFGTLYCEESENKCYDYDGDKGDDQYLVKNLLVAGELDSEYCIQVHEDKCSDDGKILYEVVCTDIVGQSNSGYAIQEVYCDCVDGACVDLVDKEKMSTPVNQNLKPFVFTPDALEAVDRVVLDHGIPNLSE